MDPFAIASWIPNPNTNIDSIIITLANREPSKEDVEGVIQAICNIFELRVTFTLYVNAYSVPRIHNILWIVKRIASFITEYRPQFLQYVVGSAILISNDTLVTILTLAFKIKKPASTNIITSEEDDIHAFLSKCVATRLFHTPPYSGEV